VGCEYSSEADGAAEDIIGVERDDLLEELAELDSRYLVFTNQ
jgi:hypothetical protein